MDQQRLWMFARSDPSHQKAAEAAWLASGGTITFVGEWHTHPTGILTPSPRDFVTYARSKAFE